MERIKEMQKLLDDIELDIQELKCLMQGITADPESKLRIVAKRSIQQMHMRLDELQKILESSETRIEEQKRTTVVISEPLKEIKTDFLRLKSRKRWQSSLLRLLFWQIR